MDKLYYPQLEETLYRQTLPNGLRVLVVPKPGFSKKYAYFATDYGSMHTEFTLEGKTYQVPAGVAHYLEHKLFDMPGRDVAGEFASLGAGVNAFTSYDMTAYYFSCTDAFESCLRLLLEFVSTPYFTEETVEKERGIIAQEIGMCLDEPGTQAFESFLQNLYEHHPVRVPILGTQESIGRITPQILALCHRAFYCPANMVLCVVGDVEPEAVASLTRQVLGDTYLPPAQKAPFPPEKPQVVTAESTGKAELSMPLFCLGFKSPFGCKNEAAVRQEILGDLAAEILFGESSDLYLQLYEQGIIDPSFGGGYETFDGCAQLYCSGDSDDPRAVREALFRQLEKLQSEGIREDYLLRLKRSALGRRIRDLDSFDSSCYRLCACCFANYDYFDFPNLYSDISDREILDFLAENVRADRCSLSILNPIQEVNHA